MNSEDNTKEFALNGKTYSVRVVTRREEFAALKGTWNALAESGKSYVPWMCWEWYDLWIRHFMGEKKLLVLVLRQGRSINAIAPLLTSSRLYKGIVRISKIELIGNAHSPIRNFLFPDVDDEIKQELVGAVLHFLQRIYRKWDVLELDRVPEENGCGGNIQNAIAKSRLANQTFESEGNWYLDRIECTSEQYFDNQPYELRRQVENKKKRLRQRGEWRFEDASNAENLNTLLDIYDELRDRSWKAPEKGRAFMRDFYVMTRAKGWLYFEWLYSQDSPVAAQKWVIHDETAYIVSLVYHKEYKKYSPGSILSTEMFRKAIDEKRVREIDYLHGDEPYKKNWTPQRRGRMGIRIYNRNLKTMIISPLAIHIYPRIRRLKSILSIRKSQNNPR